MRTKIRKALFFFFSSIAFLSLSVPSALAVSLIRDAEIEHTLRMLSTPIFKQAGLTPENVNIFIVNDDAINAYVAGGANIFLHTGLIKQMRDPSMLIGVIAHETGHIAGGHLAQGSERLRGAQIGMILGYVLGAAAAVGGSGDVGMAVLTGSQSMAHRSLLAYTRGHEQAADQAALGYLDSAGISATGMLNVFEILRRQELRQYGTIDPYLRTHPLSKSRIEHIRNHVDKSPVKEGAYPKSYTLPFERMQAKLYAFLEIPPRSFARYPERNKDEASRLARAVAWYKIPELEKSITEMDSLIAEHPSDPFYHELKGQILYENGQVEAALDSYEKSVEILPDSPLILSSLAAARIATNRKEQIDRAVNDLTLATRLDRSNANSWRLLATAEGKRGNEGESSLALAEEALVRGAPEDAMMHAERALKILSPTSSARLRAEDAKRSAKQLKQDIEDLK